MSRTGERRREVVCKRQEVAGMPAQERFSLLSFGELLSGVLANSFQETETRFVLTASPHQALVDQRGQPVQQIQIFT